MPQASDGILTQALQNMTAAARRIAACQGLPAGAEGVQSLALYFMNTLRGRIEQMQGQVLHFASTAKPAINDTLALCAGGGNPEVWHIVLSAIQEPAQAVQSDVDMVSAELTDFEHNVIDGYKNLLAVEQGLKVTEKNLQSEIRINNEKIQTIQKKMRTLGIVSIFSSIVSPGSMLAWEAAERETQRTVADLYSTMSAAASQLVEAGIALQSVNGMSADFQRLVGNISSIKNAIAIVAGDVTEIGQDVGSQDSPLLGIFLRAAYDEVRTLQQDAS